MLSQKENQIVNLVASVTAGCKPCTVYHVKKCRESGIQDKFIFDTIVKTEQICYNAINIMSAKVYDSIDIDKENEEVIEFERKNKTDVIIGLVVSYTLNSTDLFDIFLTFARELEISKKEISDLIENSTFIYKKAKAHIEILSDKWDIMNKSSLEGSCSSGCAC